MPMNLSRSETDYIHISDVNVFINTVTVFFAFLCQSFSSTSQQRRYVNLEDAEMLNSLNSPKENNVSERSRDLLQNEGFRVILCDIELHG